MSKLAWILFFFLAWSTVYTVAEAQSSSLTSVLTWTNADTANPVQIDKAAASTGPFTKLATVTAGVVTYTDATNTAGTTACYRVENFNVSGNGPSSNVACKTFPPVPTVAPVLNPIQ